MNGREFFNKYNWIVNLTVLFYSVLPKIFRKFLFDLFRNVSGKRGLLIRYIILRSLNKKVGQNVLIGKNVTLICIENLIIGDNVSIHSNSYIDASGGVTIGSNVSIAHSCSILSTSHSYNDQSIPIKYNPLVYKTVNISDDVWIGCKAIVLFGVNIGSRSVIGAASLVRKDIPDNCIGVGIPCKVIKRI